MYQIRDIASMIDAQVMGQAPLTIDWLLTDSLSIYYDLRGEYYFGPKKALRRMANTAPDDTAVYERALHEPSPENLAAWVGVLEETFSRRYRP